MTKTKPPSYCEAVSDLDKTALHRIYHDTAYGFSLDDDNQLFERLVWEINQAGLSWSIILAKQKNFFKAYHGFQIKKVASYTLKDRSRLLSDPGIIRNRLKVDATIHNAKMILSLQKEYGSFKKWLNHHHPLSLEKWTSLFKKTFKFTGGEIVNEFLVSIGYLEGAHIPSCPVYAKVLKTKPPWIKKNQ